MIQREPQPHDFGLEGTPPVAEHELTRFRTLVRCTAYACVYLALSIAFWTKFDLRGPLFAIPAAVLLGAFLVRLLQEPLLSMRFPAHAKYLFAKQEYETARAKYEAWLRTTQESFWNGLRGLAFEHAVTELLNHTGRAPRLTRATGDEGVDLVLGDGTLVQCKAHARPVGPDTARELYGTLRHFEAPHAILISTRGFTPAVRKFVRGKPITLWETSDLINLAVKVSWKDFPRPPAVKKRPSPERAKSETAPVLPIARREFPLEGEVVRTASTLTVVNRSNWDWENVEMTINANGETGRFWLLVDRIPAGGSRVVSLNDFSHSNGRGFDPGRDEADSLRLSVPVSDLQRGTVVRTFAVTRAGA